jgi:hypothetical protein
MASQSTRRSAANPYVTGGPSRYLQTKGGTSSIPSTGIRTGGTISVGGAPSAKGGAPSAKVPTGGEPGEPTNLPEAYNPIIDAETENAPIDPNRQEAIANQARAPRFSIGNPRVGNIDLGSLLSAKSSEGFDPNAPIGGANVPFQETKGVGGFFRRMFGDTANEQNVAAQQAQGAEWRQDAKEQKAEERLLNRMREGDKPAAERFTRQLEENKAIRGEESATRLRERGEDTATRKGEREQDRADRLARETEAEKARLQERQDRLDQQLQENALRDAAFGQSQLNANRPSMTSLSGGGLAVMDPRAGSINLVNPGTVGFGTMPGTAPSTRQVYPQVKAPVNPNTGGGGGQVDRGTGATMGGPLPVNAGATPAPRVTPPRSGLMDMIGAGAENVAGALGLEGISQIPAELGDLLTRDPQEIQKAARSRARYMNPSMQRTY